MTCRSAYHSTYTTRRLTTSSHPELSRLQKAPVIRSIRVSFCPSFQFHRASLTLPSSSARPRALHPGSFWHPQPRHSSTPPTPSRAAPRSSWSALCRSTAVPCFRHTHTRTPCSTNSKIPSISSCLRERVRAASSTPLSTGNRAGTTGGTIKTATRRRRPRVTAGARPTPSQCRFLSSPRRKPCINLLSFATASK